MSGENGPTQRQGPPTLPALGTLLVDAHERIGEFRGEWCGFWSLRPVTGGREWTVNPGDGDVEPVSPEQRLRAETARANARSRGELL